MSVNIRNAKSLFQSEYGGPPRIMARAPGRVNIIGEHTDYNHGFVLPMAIDRETVILSRPRADRSLHAFAANLGRRTVADLERPQRDAEEPWIDYVVGVANELAKLGKAVRGADIVIVGDVPIGAGLSSSASLEMAALVLFESLGGFQLDGSQAPELGRRVENDFLGVSSGIMDQFIARMGKANHALFLDCRTHDYEQVPVKFAEATFVIANTGVTRGLTASKYNERVGECAEAVRIMRERLPRTGTHLRDFAIKDLESTKRLLPDAVYRRARHVLTEDKRTQSAAAAMRAGDAVALGKLMDQSDASLRVDYEVTCPELDSMTSTARSFSGCFGSRMTGAGFGGCTVSLVCADKVAEFAEFLLTRYKEQTGFDGDIIVSAPADGAGPIPV